MNKEKQISLAEILDSLKAYPLAQSDLERINLVYGVDLSFYEGERVCLYYKNKEIWFKRDVKDKLYYFKLEVDKQ